MHRQLNRLHNIEYVEVPIVQAWDTIIPVPGGREILRARGKPGQESTKTGIRLIESQVSLQFDVHDRSSDARGCGRIVGREETGSIGRSRDSMGIKHDLQ